MCTCNIFYDQEKWKKNISQNCKNVSVTCNKDICNLNQGSVFHVLGWLAAKRQVVIEGEKYLTNKCSNANLKRKQLNLGCFPKHTVNLT